MQTGAETNSFGSATAFCRGQCKKISDDGVSMVFVGYFPLIIFGTQVFSKRVYISLHLIPGIFIIHGGGFS